MIDRRNRGQGDGSAARVAKIGTTDSKDVVRRLLDHIRAEGLQPGDRLPSIRQLAATLNISPNIVRDAMVQAQTMGLVRIHPRSGAFLQSLNYSSLVDAFSSTIEASLMQVDHNLFHLLDARQLIEVETAGLAAKRRELEDLLPVRQALEEMYQYRDSTERTEFINADVRFHQAIAHVAGNPALETVLEALLGLLRPYLFGLPQTAESRRRSEQSHGKIYETILAGDTDGARAAMLDHLSLARVSLLKKV